MLLVLFARIQNLFEFAALFKLKISKQVLFGIDHFMNMRYIFTLLFLSLFSWSGNSQITISNSIKWEDLREVPQGDRLIKTLTFEGQTCNDNFLPLICFDVPDLNLGSTIDSLNVTLSDTTWVYATPEENDVIGQRFTKKPTLISTRMNEERKKQLFFVSIDPIREISTGVYQKMVHYSAIIKPVVKPKATLKSTASANYASHSVLASGKWVKISVSETGVQKISYAQLSNWGFNNPANVKVFGNGGDMLPRLNSTWCADDLIENSTMHRNDNLYFFAKGPVSWTYNASKDMYIHQLHDYTSVAYYFLTDEGSGKTIASVDYSTQPISGETSSFDDYQYHEQETENLFGSGIHWYGEKMDATSKTSLAIPMSITDLDLSKPIKIYTTAVARSNESSSLSIAIDNTALQTLHFSKITIGDSEGSFAREASGRSQFYASNASFNINLSYQFSTNTSSCWLDAITIQGRRALKYQDKQFVFRDRETVATSAMTRFLIQTNASSLNVWAVTSHTQPMMVSTQLNGSGIQFAYPTNEIKEFVAFDPTAPLLTPQFVGEVANQDLHGEAAVDYLIVTHPDYLTQANRLALLHQEHNQLSTLVVTPEMIYNEFSSGQPDITAIRRFAKMFYDRAGNDPTQIPKYLLLFGDGSYDNRSTTNNNSRILTFQSENSIHQSESYVTDDYFGFLDDTEGDNPLYNALDIGIGRFPVNTIEQATTAVDKVETYLTSQINSNWSTRLTFIGDDGDSNTHMIDADKLATKVAENHPGFDIKKIYFDAYHKEKLSSGDKYPEVVRDINSAIERGSLILNYSGHGGTGGLSHEGVVNIPSIMSWKNIDRLPLFITATCTFSRFDLKSETSAGEWVFLNPKGGGIALLTTTRIAYTNWNYEINSKFYDYAFNKDANADRLALGDILMMSKRSITPSVNKLIFTLIGDPAIKLNYPDNWIETYSINDQRIDDATPTLKALDKAKISAQIISKQAVFDTNYQGEATVVVYDKPKEIVTQGNVNGQKFTYTSYENILFNGKVSVTDGQLNTQFVVPQDIQYNVGNGRISYYASGNNKTAFGGYNAISIGGIGDGLSITDGPDIDIWLNNKRFINGQTVGSTPLLMVELHDENGINTSGNGIGHDLVATITGSESYRYVLNNYFTTHLDSYQSGSIEYDLPELLPGHYTLTLKAWNTGNNSAEKTISFVVSNDISLEISQMHIYPVPLKSGTNLSISFDHNMANEDIDIVLCLYDLSGQQVGLHQASVDSSHGTTAPISFIPHGGNGQNLGVGIYIIQMEATSDSGKKTIISKKIMISE